MSERRINRRQKSFLRGYVYFDRRRGVMSCLVRDLSGDGARILFSENVTIPDVINLHIPLREQTFRCKVQWRRGDEIGLTIPEAGAAAPTSTQESELIQRVAHLETEISTLRRTVKLLRRENRREPDFEAA